MGMTNASFRILFFCKYFLHTPLFIFPDRWKPDIFRASIHCAPFAIPRPPPPKAARQRLVNPPPPAVSCLFLRSRHGAPILHTGPQLFSTTRTGECPWISRCSAPGFPKFPGACSSRAGGGRGRQRGPREGRLLWELGGWGRRGWLERRRRGWRRRRRFFLALSGACDLCVCMYVCVCISRFESRLTPQLAWVTPQNERAQPRSLTLSQIGI